MGKCTEAQLRASRKYYATKVKPFRNQKAPNLRYRCAYCGTLSFPKRLASHLFNLDVWIQRGRKYQSLDRANYNLFKEYQWQHSETLAKKSILFLKSIWTKEQIIEALGIQPTIIEKQVYVDRPVFVEKKIPSYYNLSESHTNQINKRMSVERRMRIE